MDNSVVANVKEFSELEKLPNQVPELLEKIETALEHCGGQFAALSRGVQGVCLPVQEDDVGSVIAHALLSRQAQEQMSAQWVALTNGQTCCPLADPVSPPRGALFRSPALSTVDGKSCWASFPASLFGEEGTARSSGCAAKMAPPASSPSAASSSTSPVLPSPSTASPPPACGPCAAASGDGGSAGGASSSSWSTAAGNAWHRKWLPSHACGQGDLLARQPWEEEWTRRGVRAALTGPAPKEPITVEFSDKEARYTVQIHHAPQYHLLRHWLCGDDLNFVRSIYKCKRITPQGGKSRAAFFISHDRRFLLKAVSKADELRTLMTKQEAVMGYMDKVIFDKLPSVLAQIVGFFTVTVSSRSKSKASKPRSFIVQRNLRFSLHNMPHCVFDIKGIMKRYVKSAAGLQGQGFAGLANAAEGSDDEDGEGPTVPQIAERAKKQELVLWDQNFREWTGGKPLCLQFGDSKYLEDAVWNDTSMLLSKQALMDYSLLLVAVPPEGVDNPDAATREEGSTQDGPPGTLSVGIIDYLGPYTWDKLAESKAKQFIKDVEPTVIPPQKYAERFRSAMGTFFVADTAPSSASSAQLGQP